ncbi:hypothetical protein PULV_a1979 [Pseudoalteromonas ulvae UL12]|nr:hypothetical protein [Pseudoalteromonas ulvae UL12]
MTGFFMCCKEKIGATVSLICIALNFLILLLVIFAMELGQGRLQ